MKNNQHWYVVANREAVKIFIQNSDLRRLKQIKELNYSLGGAKRSALVRKQAGRGMKRGGGRTLGRFSIIKHDPKEDVAIQFARKISLFLERERARFHFGSLTVVAEPRFLGKIRKAMGSEVKKCVKTWLARDLNKTPIKELPSFLLPPSKKEGELYESLDSSR